MSDNKNEKAPSKSQNKGGISKNSSSTSRKTKTHSIGENLSAQEELGKAYELRPKPKVDPKKKK